MVCLLTIVISKTHADDENGKGWKYDPQCGMSKEEFEWRCAQADRVNQRMPQALEKLNSQLQITRGHFIDDPDALRIWDVYENDVRYAFAHNLKGTLMSPLSLPNSVLYEQLMNRKAQSKTFVGMISGGLDKFKQVAARNKRLVGAGVVVSLVATSFALGLAVGRNPLHEETKET